MVHANETPKKQDFHSLRCHLQSFTLHLETGSESILFREWNIGINMDLGRYGYDEFPDIFTTDHYANMCCVTEPNTLKEANLEKESLLENESWHLVTLPKDCKTTGSRWAFKVQRNNDGNITSADSLLKLTHRCLVLTRMELFHLNSVVYMFTCRERADFSARTLWFSIFSPQLLS